MSRVLSTEQRVDGVEWKPPVAAPRASSKKRWIAVTVLAVVVIGLGAVLYKGLTSALVYFYTVKQAVAMRSALGNSTFRMEGVVVPHSITPTSVGVDFGVRFDHSVVRVIETGAPPQLFQPNVPVVVVGHFSGSSFISDQIMIKHSANYVAAHPGRITHAGGTS
ncbi:MAG: cytochrome c maturation protein CcmE [Acidimicrobiales bacterium]